MYCKRCGEGRARFKGSGGTDWRASVNERYGDFSPVVSNVLVGLWSKILASRCQNPHAEYTQVSFVRMGWTTATCCRIEKADQKDFLGVSNSEHWTKLCNALAIRGRGVAFVHRDA